MNYTLLESQGPFYHVLSIVKWHIFLTLQFRTLKYKGKGNASAWRRRDYLKNLVIDIKTKLQISRNDLIYFGTEEINLTDECHIHVLFHVKKPMELPIEKVRRTILQTIDSKIVIIPQPAKDSHPSDMLYRHCETVNSSEDALKYINKLKNCTEYEKEVFYDTRKNLVQFVEGYIKNKEKGFYASTP